MQRLLPILAVLVSACTAQPPQGPERIILVVIDTLRRDHLSSYGGAIPTPHIDSLAERGQRFDHAFSAFHQTTMSMGALFTGHVPSIESPSGDEPLPWTQQTWCGMARFAGSPEPRCIPEELDTLASRMAEAGYWTVGITSNPLLFEPAGLARGFADWQEVGVLPRLREGAAPHRGPVLHTEERSAAHVHRALQAALARRPTDRFFLYLHYMEAHDYRESGLSYAAGVRRADDAVGQLLGILAAEGLREGSVLVLTSDHGERLAELHPVRGTSRHHGNPSFDYLIRVPLIVSPAVFGDTGAFVRGEDLLPRLLALAGQPAATLHGLAPRELYLSEQRWRSYRRGRWKSFLSRRDGRLLLFDLAADPGETRDVAGRHPEVVRAHRARVQRLAEELAAPTAPDVRGQAADRRLLEALGYVE